MQMWIIYYIKENNDPSIDPNIIWEAAKATLRGLIISYTSFKKREKIKLRQELEREVNRCEVLHKFASTDENWKQLNTARAKLNIDLTNEIITQMNLIRQKNYEFGNKPSKLLAYQLKKQPAERAIKAIRLKDNKITYHPKQINQTFYEFYNKL